jgi:hypothetical protein
MEFINGVLDYGTAPEIYVHDIERVTLLSAGIVRVSLFAPYHVGQQQEMRTVIHLLWDRQRFIKAGTNYDRARAAVAFAEGFRLANAAGTA